ncbi:MAG: heparinase II/III-family protein [Mediterranea sp.]|jgi:hypothetical protein|nr:heparinase II/III-family protein [Mediterranea sp.]
MNKLRFLSICLLLTFATSSYAYTERNLLQHAADLSQLKAALVMDRQWVPYPDYADRAGWDTLLGDHKEFLIEQGEVLLNYQWKLIKATDYMEFERSGNRNVMQIPYDDNIIAISRLLLAELAEGKGRFVDQLINGVYQACEMTSWALSAHLVVQHSRRSLPDYRENIIDLVSGDLSSLLSWTYYFLHKEFDKENTVIAERLRHEIERRTLQPYMNENRFWWMAFNYKPGALVNNWNPWCNSNVLQCFFLLEDDRDRLAEAVYRTMISVDKFINYTHSDGACEEGPSYWGHAAGKLYDYLQMLSDGTGGKVSIFDQPMIKNMGEYIARSYVGNGWVVNFADASAKGGGDAPLVYRYGKAVGSKLMEAYSLAQISATKEEPLAVQRDIFRALQSLLYVKEMKQATTTTVAADKGYTWYPETEFCYMQNKSGFFLAAKGGFNDESHNHNDAGTFSLYLHTTPIFIDAGVGTYTRQTFSNERYTIWTMQSNYHNLPLINGVPQAYGSRYRASQVSFDAKRSLFSADIATAYPAEAGVKQWVRSYALRGKTVKVTDAFVLNELKAPTQVNFLTWGKVDCSLPGTVTVEVNGEKVRLTYDARLFRADMETLRLDDPRLSNVWGGEIYRVSLTTLHPVLTGTYTYTITSLN